MHCGDRFASHSMRVQHQAVCDDVHKEGPPNVSSDTETKQESMPTRETNASQPPTTDPPAENVPKPLGRMKKRIIQRVQPFFHKKLKFSCSYCPRAFANSWQLNVHVRLHTGEKPYSCDYCGMRFIRKDYVKPGLAGHLRTHAVGRPHNCKLCNRGFWNKTLLRNHYRKCKNGCFTNQESEGPLTGEIDFALNESVLVFKEGSKTTGTGVLQTNFSCKDEAVDEYPQNSEENQEQSNSSKEKKTVQYQCSECDKSFTDGLMLISHLEDHGREEQQKRRNTCSKCGRVCSNQANLEKHMRMHGSGPAFPCPSCSAKFDTISELESHKSCHDPSRPYVCRLCNLRFLTRPSLCSHYRDEHEDDSTFRI
uniref:C2H2-type domain-containing protein n=1 Tax=Amphiprion ocellaris TaxID=80972 RepID=A0AAQ5X868_AMPOC